MDISIPKTCYNSGPWKRKSQDSKNIVAEFFCYKKTNILITRKSVGQNHILNHQLKDHTVSRLLKLEIHIIRIIKVNNMYM
jgi:hypothetical protein